MIKVNKAQDRSCLALSWLESSQTFPCFNSSFGSAVSGFSDLSVLNAEIFKPGGGFGNHPHFYMELFYYMMSGELSFRYQDGAAVALKPGDIHHVSAGELLVHVEKNQSREVDAQFMMFWLKPEAKVKESEYGKITVQPKEKLNCLKLIASPDGQSGSLTVRQDVQIFSTRIEKGLAIPYALGKTRKSYVHVVSGMIHINDLDLSEGDGAQVVDEPMLFFFGSSPESAEALIWDLR